VIRVSVVWLVVAELGFLCVWWRDALWVRGLGFVCSRWDSLLWCPSANGFFSGFCFGFGRLRCVVEVLDVGIFRACAFVHGRGFRFWLIGCLPDGYLMRCICLSGAGFGLVCTAIIVVGGVSLEFSNCPVAAGCI